MGGEGGNDKSLKVKKVGLTQNGGYDVLHVDPAAVADRRDWLRVQASHHCIHLTAKHIYIVSTLLQHT